MKQGGRNKEEYLFMGGFNETKLFSMDHEQHEPCPPCTPTSPSDIEKTETLGGSLCAQGFRGSIADPGLEPLASFPVWESSQ